MRRRTTRERWVARALLAMFVAVLLASLPASAARGQGETLNVPDTVTAGQLLGIDGGGWSPLAQVTLWVTLAGSESRQTDDFLADTDESGAFSTELPVQGWDPVGYTVHACQDCGDPDGYPLMTSTFVLVPTFRIAPDAADPGAPVVASGEGWFSGETVQVQTTDPATGGVLDVGSTAADGGVFSVEIDHSALPAGDYTMVACQRCDQEDRVAWAAPFVALAAATSASPVASAPATAVPPTTAPATSVPPTTAPTTASTTASTTAAPTAESAPATVPPSRQPAEDETGTWLDGSHLAVVGVVLLVAGVALTAWSLRRRSRSGRTSTTRRPAPVRGTPRFVARPDHSTAPSMRRLSGPALPTVRMRPRPDADSTPRIRRLQP